MQHPFMLMISRLSVENFIDSPIKKPLSHDFYEFCGPKLPVAVMKFSCFLLTSFNLFYC